MDVFARNVNWYDNSGRFIGAGTLHDRDIQDALLAAHHSGGSYILVVGTMMAFDFDAPDDNRDVDVLLNMSPFIFGETTNYWVAHPKIRPGLRDEFQERGFTFKVLIPDEAKALLSLAT